MFLIAGLHRLLFVAIFLALFVPIAFAENSKGSGKENGKGAKAPEKEVPAWSGLYLAKIISIDPKFRYLFVRPRDGKGRRKSFYLNQKTIYRKKRKPVSRDEIKVGREIGIRYIREGDLAYAEGVFLIEGEEINPREFEMPKKKVEKKPEAEKAGGHGEAKKPEGHGAAAPKKPSGGHH